MLRIYFITGLIVIFVSLYFNCADQIVSDCETTEDKNTIREPVSFTDIQTSVFNISCAVAGCHTGMSPAENLSLTAGQSHKNIVNVNSRQRPDLKIVLPGNSPQSYLIHKLKGENTSVMPPAGKLNSALIDSVAARIDRGASEN